MDDKDKELGDRISGLLPVAKLSKIQIRAFIGIHTQELLILSSSGFMRNFINPHITCVV